MTVRILTGDCRDVLKSLPDNSVDSIVTDPPYHLTAGKKGGSGTASEHEKSSPFGAVSRLNSAGFMGMKWDGGDVAFQPATWAEAMRVLKPGGLLVAFGGTRTYHRLVVAIEDAGFEVRDMLAWLYGSGFPKGTDKAKIPAEWAGWNTALKPAIEPICLGRKPMDGTLAENLRKWGTGAMWIDGCRIAVFDEDYEHNHSGDRGHAGTRGTDEEGATNIRAGGGNASALGRWPANVLHDGSEEVVEVFPRDAGASAPVRGTESSAASVGRVTGQRERVPGAFHADTGSAARFFYCAKADRADRNEGLQGMPQAMPTNAVDRAAQREGVAASAGRGSRSKPRENHHPTVKPTDLMRWLCRLVTPPGGTVLDPFTGSGSTLKAAELEGFKGIGIELDPAYVEIAQRRISADAPLFASVEVQA